MIETVRGRVLRVVFAADGGEFAVLRLAVDGREAPVAAVGPLGGAVPGEQLALEGEWERHTTHGEQFRAVRVVAEVPTSREGVARYLAGLRGIGPRLAERLVDAFGEQAIDVLEHETWRAAQIKGVGKRRAAQAAEDAAARSQERAVMVYLQGLGVSPAYAARIRRAYGAEAITKLRENPYLLARDVSGIGFHTADQIARKLGIGPSAPERLEAGLLFVVGSFGDDGHTFAPRSALLERTAALLDVDAGLLAPHIDALARSGYLVLEDEAVFPTPMHRAEQELATRVARLLHAERGPPPADAEDAELSDEQRQAVTACHRAGVVVITGGPGTGKTTVVRAIVASWTAAGRRVRLAAPTGRAAKRLSEATGQPAVTLHRLLEWGRGSSGGAGFGRGQEHQLEVDLLVVDEASMLDTMLARALLRAMPLGATLVLVGDVDQLPSVGAGQVLGDLIASGGVPVTRLQRIFRQAEGSAIVENAHRILAGELPVSSPRGEEQAPGALFVVQADDPERARDPVVRLCKERIPSAYRLDPVRDVQVLAPMHRGPAGTEELNRALQAELNPRGEELRHAGLALRVGDKVMQSRNDYDRDVFNGDIGVVMAVGGTDADEETAVEVSFDGRLVGYDADSAAALELAYAITVHKSQGSEYPAVVIPILFQHYPLLKRNLLYTAVTRGKRLVVIVGSTRALRRAVEVTGVDERHTRLAQRLAHLGAKLVP